MHIDFFLNYYSHLLLFFLQKTLFQIFYVYKYEVMYLFKHFHLQLFLCLYIHLNLSFYHQLIFSIFIFYKLYIYVEFNYLNFKLFNKDIILWKTKINLLKNQNRKSMICLIKTNILFTRKKLKIFETMQINTLKHQMIG